MSFHLANVSHAGLSPCMNLTLQSVVSSDKANCRYIRYFNILLRSPAPLYWMLLQSLLKLNIEEELPRRETIAVRLPLPLHCQIFTSSVIQSFPLTRVQDHNAMDPPLGWRCNEFFHIPQNCTTGFNASQSRVFSRDSLHLLLCFYSDILSTFPSLSLSKVLFVCPISNLQLLNFISRFS